MKLRFAHQLRAMAALSVILYHYWGIFFSPVVRSMTGTPASFVPVQPGYTRHVLAPVTGDFYYGVFGVGVFFLISGLVIPISLRNLSTGKFLVRRFFRIYPVYWICLLISLAMYVTCSWYWSTPLSDRVSWSFLWRNLSLLHSAAGIASLDFVCWSLAVEVKFYILVALIFLVGRQAHRVILLSIACLAMCCAAAYASTHGLDPQSSFSYLISDTKYISFMLLGCLFYYVLFDDISPRAALGYGVVIYALFATTNAFYEHEFLGPLVKNYSYALMLFWACYVLREKFKDHRILDFVADISFPLYLLHSMIGYVSMPILIDQGVPYTFAWMISLALAVLAAFLVHIYVEVPVNAWGKSISNLNTRSALQTL